MRFHSFFLILVSRPLKNPFRKLPLSIKRSLLVVRSIHDSNQLAMFSSRQYPWSRRNIVWAELGVMDLKLDEALLGADPGRGTVQELWKAGGKRCPNY